MRIQLAPRWLSHNSRPAGTVIDTIVLHATAGSTFRSAWDALTTRELSYHFVIEDQRDGRDGLIHKLVPYQKRAWHAGKSFGPQGADVNDYSIGICFINLNNGHDPYSEKQIAAAVELVRSLKRDVKTLRYVTTHAIISPGRKTDPLGFPVWQFAVDTGLELWRGRSSAT